MEAKSATTHVLSDFEKEAMDIELSRLLTESPESRIIELIALLRPELMAHAPAVLALCRVYFETKTKTNLEQKEDVA